ncbi:hypothetical protein BCR36DRAFT_450124, partial [Piromyces finnis]
IFCILFFQNGYTHIIAIELDNILTIESDYIPYEYIYHLNVNTNSIECVFCDTTLYNPLHIIRILYAEVHFVLKLMNFFIYHLLKFQLILILYD